MINTSFTLHFIFCPAPIPPLNSLLWLISTRSAQVRVKIDKHDAKCLKCWTKIHKVHKTLIQLSKRSKGFLQTHLFKLSNTSLRSLLVQQRNLSPFFRSTYTRAKGVLLKTKQLGDQTLTDYSHETNLIKMVVRYVGLFSADPPLNTVHFSFI